IEKVVPTSLEDAKKAANDAIDGALNNKKSEINGATNLDQPTKDKLIQDATDAADAAKNAIDQATTVDAIKKAQDDGISNINTLNQGTDATKDNVQNSNSNGKVTNVDDQGNTTITYPDGSKNTISGDDYTYDDYAYNDFYQVIVKANAVQVYTLPKGNLTKEKKLVHDTTLTVLETKKIDGQVWYRIGTNRWIMAATTIKVGELENFKLKHLSKKTKTTAIVWVNKLAIYNNVNGKMTKKHLTRGTKVRIYAIASINGGEWYKIGKNKWIPAAGVHELTVEPL
ncbi:SLAP domain-containing protein, partial [Lactobacillus gallinarum]|uniref:SLAP domain-containing protein n=1 Tax=Lactobacillus gallinarum TaxID=52242 RepID=UPI0019585AFA